MSSERISIGIMFFSYNGSEMPLRIEGEPSDDAVEALWRAADEVMGRTHIPTDQWPHNPDDDSGFAFSAVYDGDDHDSMGSDYLRLPLHVTFQDMRLAVGPEDFRVRAQLSGFGGDAIFDGFMLWNFADALNFGRDALEIYGAVEVASRMGRAIRRRARRARRESADRWFHEGGEIPDDLRSAVERQHQWTDDQIQTYFELDRIEARALMAACDYSWSSELLTYVAPPDLDAVN